MIAPCTCFVICFSLLNYFPLIIVIVIFSLQGLAERLQAEVSQLTPFNSHVQVRNNKKREKNSNAKIYDDL